MNPKEQRSRNNPKTDIPPSKEERIKKNPSPGKPPATNIPMSKEVSRDQKPTEDKKDPAGIDHIEKEFSVLLADYETFQKTLHENFKRAERDLMSSIHSIFKESTTELQIEIKKAKKLIERRDEYENETKNCEKMVKKLQTAVRNSKTALSNE